MQCEHSTIYFIFMPCLGMVISTTKKSKCPFLPIFHTSVFNPRPVFNLNQHLPHILLPVKYQIDCINIFRNIRWTRKSLLQWQHFNDKTIAYPENLVSGDTIIATANLQLQQDGNMVSNINASVIVNVV